MLDRRIAVAPMMDCTDRHDRYFLRLIAPDVLLYTEMVTTGALIHGDRDRFLAFDAAEHPLALQLGGSDPAALAQCTRMGVELGYDEVNLNVGCPSPRVSSGRFGACLMQEPRLVADCIGAMQDAAGNVPVTVKCRLGVDAKDSYAELVAFVQTLADTGCNVFILHARKAWLQGLSPKQNREVPPLRYDVVRRLKEDFPALTIVINGGIKTVAEIAEHLQFVDGVMIGREAYSNPYLLAEIQEKIYGKNLEQSRQAIIEKFLPYIEEQLRNKIKLSSITRHILGLFQGEKGARMWRRHLSENAWRIGADVEVVREALGKLF